MNHDINEDPKGRIESIEMTVHVGVPPDIVINGIAYVPKEVADQALAEAALAKRQRDELEESVMRLMGEVNMRRQVRGGD